MKSLDAPSLKPILDQDRCSRVRFSGARCDRCFAGCPTDSIRITRSTLTIDNACSGCGFCVALCPNEVFSFPEESPLRFTNAGDKSGPLCCSGLLATGPVPAGTLPPSVIPCLGSISTVFVLTRILREEKPLQVVTGSCEECPMRAGEKRYRQREREIRSLFDYLGIDFSPVSISTGSATEREMATRQCEVFHAGLEKSKTLSRRDFFKQLRDTVVTHGPQSARKDTRTEDLEPAHRGPFTETRSLVDIVRKYAVGVNGERGPVPMFREIQVDENCTGCGACTHLCPTGALALDEGPAEVQLTWTPACCSLCDLCLDACVRKALHVMPCVDARRIAGETTSTIKLLQRHHCQACGNSFLSSGPDACCTDCSKTEKFMDALSKMIYGEERRASS